MQQYKSARLVAGAFVLFMLLGGCAAKQTQALLEHHPDGLATKASVERVPFFAQTEYQCGPASMAMLLGWAGVPVTPAELTPKLFIPGKKGTLQIELMATPRQYGILAYPLAPQLPDLLREVAAGHPVLVFQNLALSWYPQWHYAVVTAYDLTSKTITLHSGLEPEHTIPMSVFEHTWVRAGSWAMLALPPGTLPATAEENRYLQAAFTLESFATPKAAVHAYEAALVRWPSSLAAQMGRGNSYYAMGKLEKAGKAFLQATRDHPDAAPAFNNLAQVYLEQHRLKEAEKAIREAIRLDAGSPVYRETQAAIEGKSK
ncbi:MAG TPA: PA2778 family cysteine peptidase [Mariprofundaceae bacterium]|nr:PA2778 family cysteine peptidase [Mariprofundaceae bacterium]